MAKFVWKPVGFRVALQGHHCVGGFFGEGSSRQSSEIGFWKLVGKKKRGVGNKKRKEGGKKKKIIRTKPTRGAALSLYFFFPLVKLPNAADAAMP